MTSKQRVSGLCGFLGVFIALFLDGCVGGAPTSIAPVQPITPTPVPSQSVKGEWEWVSGSSDTGQPGTYGSLGVASNKNVPGGRGYSTGWLDNDGNLWLFGGWGVDRLTTGQGPFNDLWEFNPTAATWTWVSGNSNGNIYGQQFAAGVYGTKGAASPTNVPLARYGAVGWKDASGNLWLFGGSGYTSQVDGGAFNDLWKFDLTSKQWMWVSGSSVPNMHAFYGTRGVAAPENVPGARGTGRSDEATPVAWTDKSGNFWLFGGFGFDGSGGDGDLNDLWEFNPVTGMWTWVSGSSSVGAGAISGTQGELAPDNTPAARDDAVGWTDNDGNFWLYGGHGQDAPGTISPDLGDLWKFDPTTKEWAWISGSLIAGVAPNYGTQGVAAPSNTPGGRYGAVGWVDASGNLWLFGGFAYGLDLYFDDLWKFNPSSNQWTWVSGGSKDGASAPLEMGVYGNLGVSAAGNMPGGRGFSGSSLAWTDSSGNFWLFGGLGYGGPSTSLGELNDLWRYQP